MQAKPGVLDFLNQILTIELTVINQYFLQAEMCRNWGYEGLYKKIMALARGEMDDAQGLIRHILYLEGIPNMQRLNTVNVGENVLENMQIDLEGEKFAVSTLVEAIGHCAEVGDFTTRGMLEQMIRDEEEHVDWFETQLETIRQLGIEHFLAHHIRE